MHALCDEGRSAEKRSLQHEIEHAYVENKQLTSARGLKECDHTIVELHTDKQWFIEYNTALKEEVTRVIGELLKVSVRPADRRVARQEVNDLPELELLTTGYLSDESEVTAAILDPTSQHHQGSRHTNPHLPGFRALINHMDEFSEKPGDSDFEVLGEGFLLSYH